MHDRMRQIFLLFILLGYSQCVQAQSRSKFELYYADHSEVILSETGQTWHAIGAVVFGSQEGFIYCDSAVWYKGRTIKLRGSVIIDDVDYRLAGDSIDYDLVTDEAVARGSYVELWSREDSLFAVGQHAYYNRADEFFYMEERPTLYLRYPDTAAMVEILADYIYYDANMGRAEATGDVRISSREFSSTSDCAVTYPKRNSLDLYGNPVARRSRSEISGQFISVITVNKLISRIDVIDSARTSLIEPTDSSGLLFDQSFLSGKRIIFDFDSGDLQRITCYGQAYSWYYPDSVGKSEFFENSVSGDTITFDIVDEQLSAVSVVGGAVGSYLDKEITLADSTYVTTVDTVDYNAQKITYAVKDSLITLSRYAHVTSGEVALDAHLIEFDTKAKIINAFSAEIRTDSPDSGSAMTADLQPNPLPVILRDKNDVLFGDYLEYSIDTEKGRIVQSKSKYQTGFFYGDKMYRQQKDIFYLDKGRYTTCDADEPHFHFYSKHLKLIEGEKLIARPVVFYIGRIPILAVPYYVFPLKRGRHSGWLPFTLGNIERGDRYVRNVGYYWAASEYWDLQGAVDFYERSNRLNFFSRINYNKRYSFKGNIAGNYARETGYNWAIASQTKRTRWSLSARHNHEISPSFKINASGSIQSDAQYYNDFSANLEDRLNRNVRSQISFTKRFSRSIALSGKLVHDENLDAESRTDQLPILNLSLPQFRPFGSGRINEEGKLELKWYNNLVATYRPNLINYSHRITNDSLTYDTTITFDSVAMTGDTTVSIDTVDYRSRREFTRLNHALTLSFPLKIAQYITFNPSFGYTEEWYKIHRTDQSDAKDIDASKTYRAYIYSIGTSVSTKIYGTVYPNLLGLTGLRQVITPSVSYRYTPEINRHPEVRSYAGGRAGSAGRSQSMSFGLNHIYQAKVRKGEVERNYNLLSLTSSLSYDFEKETRKFKNLSTSFQSTLLPKVRFYGAMIHSLYKPGTDELDFWSPYLQSFSFNTNLTLAGDRFLFDDEYPAQGTGTDSASPTASRVVGSDRRKKGWNLTANYSYRESGRDKLFTKSSFVRFSLRFNLTQETSVSYSQYYNIAGAETVNNQVSIVRKLHCWTGTFFWVPIGSNRGWGFKLYVTAIPQIKIDQSQNTLSTGYFQGLK